MERSILTERSLTRWIALDLRLDLRNVAFATKPGPLHANLRNPL